MRSRRTVPWIYGQVVIRFSDGKIAACSPTTLSMDAGLNTAVEKYGEKVRNTEPRAQREGGGQSSFAETLRDPFRGGPEGRPSWK